MQTNMTISDFDEEQLKNSVVLLAKYFRTQCNTAIPSDIAARDYEYGRKIMSSWTPEFMSRVTELVLDSSMSAYLDAGNRTEHLFWERPADTMICAEYHQYLSTHTDGQPVIDIRPVIEVLSQSNRGSV